MKAYLIPGFLVLMLSCSTNEKKDKPFVVNVDSISNFGTITVEKKAPSEILSLCLDSVRNYRQGEPIPSFFFNYFLDYEYPWLTDHKTLSLRKSIFDSISNKNLIIELIKSNDFRLKKIVDSSEIDNIALLNALPLKEISNYEMAKERLKELSK